MKYQIPNTKYQKFLILAISCCLLANFFSGCAMVSKVEIPLRTFNLKGITYVPLKGLCDWEGISWDYDTFSKTSSLKKDNSDIKLMAGSNLILVDGRVERMSSPAQIYEGVFIVPYSFRQDLLRRYLPKKIYPEARAYRIKKVILDAGHGGRDPGATGRSGLREKDVVLDVSRRLKKQLEELGIEVIMTRNSDRYISLARRSEIANNSKADLFISIHANANRYRGLKGFEIYYLSYKNDDSNRALVTAENSPLRLDNDDKNKTYYDNASLNLKATLWDMIYNTNRAESIKLAKEICNATSRAINVNILGVKGAPFYVLRGTQMPAILIEIGFVSNSNEEKMLRNNYYRQQITEAIAQGINDYRKDYEQARGF